MWTGRELIVWGGQSGLHGQDLHSDGAAYSPGTGRWQVLPGSPLSPRVGQSAVWASGEMIIWGGYDEMLPGSFHAAADGAAYDPATRQWHVLPSSPLSPRAEALATWTGSEVIILGGQPAVTTAGFGGYADGAAYDPATNRWAPVAPPTPPAGHQIGWQTAVQAGGQLLAWSQWASPDRVVATGSSSAGGADLFAFDEATRRWRLVPPEPNALPGVEETIWTGTDVVVRGITVNCGACSHPFVPEATEIYDPVQDTGKRLAPDPLGGDHLVSAWVDGYLFSVNPDGQFGASGPGAASVYDPATGRWARLPAAPFACDTGQSPIWTGQQVLLYCPRSPGEPGGLAFRAG